MEAWRVSPGLTYLASMAKMCLIIGGQTKRFTVSS